MSDEQVLGIDYYHNYDESGVFREALRTVVESKPRLDRDKRYVLKLPLDIGTGWREIRSTINLAGVYPYRVRVGKDAQVPINYQIESCLKRSQFQQALFENCIKVAGEGSFKTYTDSVTGEKEIPMYVEEWYAPGVRLNQTNTP